MARRKVTNVRERQRKRVPAIPEQASASRKSPEEEKEEDCAVEQVRPRAAGSAHAPRSGRARAWRVLVSVRMRITERAWSPVTPVKEPLDAPTRGHELQVEKGLA